MAELKEIFVVLLPGQVPTTSGETMVKGKAALFWT
jgi:hypothetical protein